MQLPIVWRKNALRMHQECPQFREESIKFQQVSIKFRKVSRSLAEAVLPILTGAATTFSRAPHTAAALITVAVGGDG
jgi:hypothetical protein